MIAGIVAGGGLLALYSLRHVDSALIMGGLIYAGALCLALPP